MNVPIIVLVAIFIGLLSYYYYKYAKKKELVQIFPRFFQELYNNTSSGMSLIEAVRKSKYAEYKGLTPLIRNMCTQIEWGTPFTVALKSFGKRVNSRFIDKIITLTEKSAEFSPNIGRSVKEINEYIDLTRKLEREMSTELFPQLVSLYLVFFVFLGITYVIFNLFIPSFQFVDTLTYKTTFQHLIIIEAVLSGIVIGKITEDSYLLGVKHLIILLSISVIFSLTFF